MFIAITARVKGLDRANSALEKLVWYKVWAAYGLQKGKRVNLQRWFRAMEALAVAFFSATAPAATYTVIDLGTLGSGSSATSINALGQVAGTWSANGDTSAHAFVFSGGVMTDLGALPGGGSVATGINDIGQVVGFSGRFGDYLVPHAFLYAAGRMVDLGPLGGLSSGALGINNAGQLVGANGNPSTPTVTYHAFLYDHGTTNDLGLGFSSSSSANAINASGQVVGFFGDSSGTRHAFLYNNGVVTDLGTLGGSLTDAFAINGSGQVVGTSNGRAFLYADGALHDLGSVNGYDAYAQYSAHGINSSGQIVGTADTSVGLFSIVSKPWIYSDGAMHDLTSLLFPGSGWTLYDAVAINDAGQIAASGCGPSACHALLLSPGTTTVVEYQNTQDFAGSPGGHFFYTDDAGEQAIVDSGIDGHFLRTGRTFKAGGNKQVCRFYGSTVPGPNSHFYTISDQECASLKALQKVPTPSDVQQWNYEGLHFAEVLPQTANGVPACPAGTISVYRAYNNAYPPNGPKNPWDSAHRYSADHADIQQMVAQFGWRDEGIAFCSLQ